MSPVPTSLPLGGLPAAAEQAPTRGPDLCANLKVARCFCRDASVRLVRSDAKPTGVFELALRGEETPSGLWKRCLALSSSRPWPPPHAPPYPAPGGAAAPWGRALGWQEDTGASADLPSDGGDRLP